LFNDRPKLRKTMAIAAERVIQEPAGIGLIAGDLYDYDPDLSPARTIAAERVRSVLSRLLLP
jgi:hypothetical protein